MPILVALICERFDADIYLHFQSMSEEDVRSLASDLAEVKQ